MATTRERLQLYAAEKKQELKGSLIQTREMVGRALLPPLRRERYDEALEQIGIIHPPAPKYTTAKEWLIHVSDERTYSLKDKAIGWGLIFAVGAALHIPSQAPAQSPEQPTAQPPAPTEPAPTPTSLPTETATAKPTATTLPTEIPPTPQPTELRLQPWEWRQTDTAIAALTPSSTLTAEPTPTSTRTSQPTRTPLPTSTPQPLEVRIEPRQFKWVPENHLCPGDPNWITLDGQEVKIPDDDPKTAHMVRTRAEVLIKNTYGRSAIICTPIRNEQDVERRKREEKFHGCGSACIDVFVVDVPRGRAQNLRRTQHRV